ncbi:MAG TPA: hypothetical protein VJS11_00900 [Acidobacteriaceae bacterium]|nr:hypothetical protein [Acidobacteriaceae bacterium]
MPEAFEEQQQRFDVNRAIDLARRRHLYFLGPLLVGWLLVWSASWILPARYKSSTVILVQQPSVPKDYVLSNVNDDIATRLESLTQQMMSRTRLLLIIEKLHLYQGKAGNANPDAVVQQMRKDISVEMVRNQMTGAIDTFRVSYSASSPQIAQQVTRELTNLFISYNQQQIENESQNTTAFLEKQLQDASVALAQQEARVRQFESAHEGELPSQEASNLQILSGLQAQLQNEEDALNAAKQQQVYLQSLLGQYRALHPAAAKGPDGAPTDLVTLDAQLEKMRADLVNLRGRYTERYPAVQSLETSIAQTQKDRDQLAARLAAIKTNTTDTTIVDAGQSPELLQLKSQLQSNQAEISNREHDIAKLTTRIDQYQARLNAEPASEQQLAELTRGYEQSRTNYNDLLKKKNDSAMATNMVQMQEGERFSVLDPPTLPGAPDFPNRLKFCGIGLIAGIVLGASVVALLEFLDDRLHNDSDIEKILPVGVLSEVPEILQPGDERRAKQRAVLGWAAGVFVFVVILAGSAFSYLHA